MADIWRRLEGKERAVRSGVLAVICLLALFSVVANFGMAVVPNEEWGTTQTFNFLTAQKTISDITGHPLDADVVHGRSLPAWGPAGQLYVVGNCAGLYVSNGENYATVPSAQFSRTTWMTVELGHTFQHAFTVKARAPQVGRTESTSLVTVGKGTVAVSATATSDPHRVALTFGFYGQGRPTYGRQVDVPSGTDHKVVVVTDPAKHLVEVTVDGISNLGPPCRSASRWPSTTTFHQPGPQPPALSVVDVTASFGPVRPCARA